MAIESDIMAALVSKIQNVTEVKTINSDKILLATTDFRDHELPAVQIWDVAQLPTHERGRIRVNWSLSLELVMKSMQSGEVNQSELWRLRRDIQLAIWDEPNLGVPGVVHCIYNGNVTDLHLLEPYYIARIDFDVQFYDNLTGSC